MNSELSESETSFFVCVENLLNSIAVGSCSQVDSEVVFNGRPHNSLEKEEFKISVN